jgi:hypothetical protein
MSFKPKHKNMGTMCRRHSMPKVIVSIMAVVVTVALTLPVVPVRAEGPDLVFVPAPLRYNFVAGDVEKFQAHHWTREGYVGGIRDMQLRYKTPEEVSVEATGHALVGNNDYGAEVLVKKEGVGHIKFDYSMFRKYYDGTGGAFKGFRNSDGVDLDRDLYLDIGSVDVELALLMEHLPRLTLLYSHHFKDGVKSRLSWAGVTEDGSSKNIAPAWQEIDETVNVLTFREEQDVAGYALEAEQILEIVRSELTRQERWVSTSSGEANRKSRTQNQEPRSTTFTNKLRAERWFWEDKAYASSGYRFARLNAKEKEEIYEADEFGVVTNRFSNPKQIRGATAHMDLESHTWVGSLMLKPIKWFNSVLKFKAEWVRRAGSSSYPEDITPNTPDGIVNRSAESDTDSRLQRYGQALSLRYTGISRLALFTDLEFEQARNALEENRESIRGQSAASANDIFSRDTITRNYRGVWTLGGHYAPVKQANITMQVRHKQNNMDYDDVFETSPGASTAKSAFVDWQRIYSNEFTTRVALKPVTWLHPSLRYQFRADNYGAGFEGDATPVDADYDSHIYTFDVTAIPHEKVWLNGSFSRQAAVVSTIARLDSTTSQLPKFHADVSTWMFAAYFMAREDLTFDATLSDSRTDNFDDFSDAGLPLGTDYDTQSMTVGCRWTPHGDVTIEPRYEFNRYNANPDAEIGGYNAHTIWLDCSIKWGGGERV